MKIFPRIIELPKGDEVKSFKVKNTAKDDSLLLFKVRRSEPKLVEFSPKNGVVEPGMTQNIRIRLCDSRVTSARLLVKAVTLARTDLCAKFEESWENAVQDGTIKKVIDIKNGRFKSSISQDDLSISLASEDMLLLDSLESDDPMLTQIKGVQGSSVCSSTFSRLSGSISNDGYGDWSPSISKDDPYRQSQTRNFVESILKQVSMSSGKEGEKNLLLGIGVGVGVSMSPSRSISRSHLSQGDSDLSKISVSSAQISAAFENLDKQEDALQGILMGMGGTVDVESLSLPFPPTSNDEVNPSVECKPQQNIPQVEGQVHEGPAPFKSDEKNADMRLDRSLIEKNAYIVSNVVGLQTRLDISVVSTTQPGEPLEAAGVDSLSHSTSMIINIGGRLANDEVAAEAIQLRKSRILSCICVPSIL